MHAFPYACFELGSLMLDDEAVSNMNYSRGGRGLLSQIVYWMIFLLHALASHKMTALKKLLVTWMVISLNYSKSLHECSQGLPCHAMLLFLCSTHCQLFNWIFFGRSLLMRKVWIASRGLSLIKSYVEPTRTWTDILGDSRFHCLNLRLRLAD